MSSRGRSLSERIDDSDGSESTTSSDSSDILEAEEVAKTDAESSKLWLAVGVVMVPGGVYMAMTSEEGLNLVNSTAILFGILSLMRAFTLQRSEPVPEYVFILAAGFATAWAFINDMGLLAIILAAVTALLIARMVNGSSGSNWRDLFRFNASANFGFGGRRV